MIITEFATVTREPQIDLQELVLGTFTNWFVQNCTQFTKHGNSSEKNWSQNHLTG